MSDTVLVGMISASAALLGMGVSQFSEWTKRRREGRRWYATFFLDRKLDALNALHAALVDCHFAMNFYGNVPPRTLQEYKDKIQPKEEAYLRARVLASLYLDDYGEKVMAEALGALRQAGMSIWLHLPENEFPAGADVQRSYPDDIRQLDWQLFTRTYETAAAYLKAQLNPTTLEEEARRHAV
jgi:hypothetical protein